MLVSLFGILDAPGVLYHDRTRHVALSTRDRIACRKLVFVNALVGAAMSAIPRKACVIEIELAVVYPDFPSMRAIAAFDGVASF